jgi:hypothetical protein
MVELRSRAQLFLNFPAENLSSKTELEMGIRNRVSHNEIKTRLSANYCVIVLSQPVAIWFC